MPTYVYRCTGCGPFDHRASMAEVPDAVSCPSCGVGAPRGITAPALSSPGPAHRAAAAHERSAHAPGVVGGVPAGPAPGAPPVRAAPRDPRHERLPRP